MPSTQLCDECGDGLPLCRCRKREIAQLMFVAEHYLRLAAPSAGIQKKFGATIEDFASGQPVSDENQELVSLGAHFASAAIRLTSIDAVLKQAGVGRPVYLECLAYFTDKCFKKRRFQDSDSRAITVSEWFHVMLRDNSTHEEPPLSATEPAEERRRGIRQQFLPEATFADAHARLTRTAAELRSWIEQAHGMVLPTYR
jgi:hypothetical protein